MKLKGDQSTSRAINRRLILNLLRREGPKSRAELATITGLSPAAVTFVIGDLLAEGHVSEGETIAGLSGRRPTRIEINSANGLAIGFKLMVGAIECVVTDLATNPLSSRRLTVSDHAPETVVQTLADAVPALVQSAGRPQARLAGIGISMPGVIDNAQAICVRSHRFNWDNVPLAQMLAQEVKTSVWLEDDTNAYGIAQQLFGLGRQYRNMAVLAIGVGISCAIIIDGKLYRGANGAAGKFGHTLYEEHGRLCECGKRGCLMGYFSQPAMLQTWRAATGRDETHGLHDMLDALSKGDDAAVAVLRAAGTGIGTSLANLVNVVDPEVVVIGGEAVSFGEALLAPLRAAMGARTFRAPCPLLPDWEDNSWARGAAALVTQKLFDFEMSGGTVAGTETV
jgi:predicted NBD/HSP70 family sugar kinase